MAPLLSRLAVRAIRANAIPTSSRSIAISSRRFDDKKSSTNDRRHPNAEEYEELQKNRPNVPHMTNTNSTNANNVPKVGADKAPPELITSVDPDYVPQDAVPENTERMTGGTQESMAKKGGNAELGVGEMEGVSFKVEPNRRSGEDLNTMRARLLYQSRKRGTLESDLLLSTFASENLGQMNESQLKAFDHFLDENDWDIYYWATQQPPATSHETAEGGSPEYATAAVQGTDADNREPMEPVRPQTGEWAQTVGTFKAKYRAVPARWKNSEILSMLRRHVADRSAGGVQDSTATIDGEGLAQSVKGIGGGGLGRMPQVQNFDI